MAGIKKYSDWFKVDLHIHTDESNKTKVSDYDGSFDIQVLKRKLVENDVKLFSLTDHNIINVKAYRDYYNDFKDGDPMLLLGCEFDIAVVQQDFSILTYHTILVFNENTIEKVEEISGIIEHHFNSKSLDIKNRNLTIDDIFDLFSSYNFFYIPHAGGHKNIIDAHKASDICVAQEMVLLMECGHEKVKEKFRVKHNEGFDKLKDPDFRNRKDEAFINFSDNHNCDTYPSPKNGNHEFYYLKGEPTFETIRLAFIDPESRIKSESELDKIKTTKTYISNLAILNVDSIEDNDIEFSPNLNVIIGGASSGKSLLFNLIAAKLNNKKTEIVKYSKNIDETKICLSSSASYHQNVTLDAQQVVFIKQGDVVRYFEKGDLSELVRESEKENETITIREEFKEQKNILIDTIDNFVSNFEQFNNCYHNSFSLNKGDIDNILNSQYIFKEVVLNVNQINYDVKSNKLETLLIETNNFRNESEFDFTAEDVELIDKFINLVGSKKTLISQKNEKQERIINFHRNVSTAISNSNANLEALARTKLEAIRLKESLVENCSRLFNTAKAFNLNCLQLENYEYATKKRIPLTESVALSFEIENNVSLKNAILNCINDSSNDFSIYENYLIMLKDNSKLKQYSWYTETDHHTKITNETYAILNKFDKPLELLDYGKEGSSKNKSPGFNSEMYLKTILQQSSCKILMIDQPEDNLGNTFKNEDLINLLRKYKLEKQIILVTHNPSIVVYGDAECIILASNTVGEIKYEQIVLENKAYQKTIIDNLDGGKVIFDMRSRKYNIKKLLNSAI